MIKIEAATLEEAYKNAACSLKCSVTELKIEVAQVPSKGILGLFKKNAIIVAMKEVTSESSDVADKATNLDKREALKSDSTSQQEKVQEPKIEEKPKQQESKQKEQPKQKPKKQFKKQEQKPDQKQEQAKQQSAKEIARAKIKEKERAQNILNDTIMPASFVSTQDDEDEYDDVSSYLADYEDEHDYCEDAEGKGICGIVETVKEEINRLFNLTCFKIDSIDVSVYNEDTLLVEFKGEDAALLIGKEGYRYKALSYMIFNWINTKYQVQLRLEIAEFLKNQEESITKYLVGVCENIEKDGRAQTKILDGVLVQIALNELREKYPDKYIVIRSTRDGLKYIIVNDYHTN